LGLVRTAAINRPHYKRKLSYHKYFYQLVEHCTGNAEVMSSNLIEARIFFGSSFQQLHKLLYFTVTISTHLLNTFIMKTTGRIVLTTYFKRLLWFHRDSGSIPNIALISLQWPQTFITFTCRGIHFKTRLCSSWKKVWKQDT